MYKNDLPRLTGFRPKEVVDQQVQRNNIEDKNVEQRSMISQSFLLSTVMASLIFCFLAVSSIFLNVSKTELVEQVQKQEANLLSFEQDMKQALAQIPLKNELTAQIENIEGFFFAENVTVMHIVTNQLQNNAVSGLDSIGIRMEVAGDWYNITQSLAKLQGEKNKGIQIDEVDFHQKGAGISFMIFLQRE